MSTMVPVEKDDKNQAPIPSEWRGVLFEIVESFRRGDFSLSREVAGVRSLSEEDASRIAGNFRAHAVRLTSLPDDAWRTSVCQWMRGYWDVLVDLYTEEEGASDLVLSLRVYEAGSGYVFEVQSVHVP